MDENKKEEIEEVRYNKKCIGCKRKCKQFDFTTIVRCPLYEEKRSK